MIRDKPEQEMSHMNLKVEPCLTLPGRILRSLIFILSGFGRVTPHRKICVRDLASRHPFIAETLCRHVGGE